MNTLKQRLQYRAVLEKKRLVEESLSTTPPIFDTPNNSTDTSTILGNPSKVNTYDKVKSYISKRNESFGHNIKNDYNKYYDSKEAREKNANILFWKVPEKSSDGNRYDKDGTLYNPSGTRSTIGFFVKTFFKFTAIVGILNYLNINLNNFLKNYLIVDLPTDKVITQNNIDRFANSLKMNVFPEFVSKTFHDVDELSKRVSNTLSHWIPFSETDTNLLNDIKHQLLAYKAQIEVGLTKAKEYGSDDTSLLISKARVDKNLQLVTNELQSNLDKLNGVKVESSNYHGFLITASLIAIALAYYGIIKYSDTFKLKFLETKINDLFVKYSEKYPELMKLKSEIQNEEIKFIEHYKNDNFIQNKIRLSLSTELMLKKQMILIIGLLYVCYRYLYELKLTYDVKNAESLIKTIKNNDYKIGEKIVFDIVEIYNSWSDMVTSYFPEYSKYLKSEIDNKFFKLCIDFTKSNSSNISKIDNQKQVIKPNFVKPIQFQNKPHQLNKKG